MPIIADHCKPDGWRGRSEPHDLVCQWPDDVYVQWGGHGVVIDRKAKTARNTAFFEAFPKPKGFIRGEGETVADAERQAFAQFERQRDCRHVYGRRGYLNGGGFCLKCKGFFASVFPEIEKDLQAWKHPLSKVENDLLTMYEAARYPLDERAKRNMRKLAIRKRVFGADETPMTFRDHVGMLFTGGDE